MEPITKPNRDSIRTILEARDFKSLRRFFKDTEFADIAEIFSEMELRELVPLYRLVPRARRAELFAHLEFEIQEELLEELPDVIVVSLLNEMEPDDRTKLLEDLHEDLRHKLLLKLDPEERQVAWQLLSYPEGSVGRLMTPDFLSLDVDMRVVQALNYIHWNTSLPVEYLNYLFVTGPDGRLVGEVSLASLVICDPPTKRVGDIMFKSRVSLLPHQEDHEAIETFRKYDRLYMPVLDNEQRILGIVSADDVFDLAEDQATEDIQQFGGHGPLEDSYFQTPFLTLIKKRAGWLAFLFISGFLSGEAIRNYEDSLSKWAFLVFFLPMITSAGGNSGSQSASLIIRGLAINELSSKDVWRIFKREALVGLTLGLILGSLGFGRAVYWGLGQSVGVVIFSSVVSVVVFGVITGSMLPFIFRAIKLDPAVVSSPFISTIVDFTGIMVLFNYAMFLMGK